MREIEEHRVVDDKAPQLVIRVVDEPGAGGANHEYRVYPNANAGQGEDICWISFQNGPINEVGLNGVTQEALLAIIIDRLRSFQLGPFPSHWNGQALQYCEAALAALKSRTLERLSRGVEGTSAA